MELEEKILQIYKLPLSYDNNGQFIIDAQQQKVADVRGWGVLQYQKNGELLQDTLGEMLVKSFNEKYGTKIRITSVTSEPPDWAKDGEPLGGVITDGIHQTFKFYKEPNLNWYIDLPEWKGSKDDLQMVMGADTMLDRFAEGEDKVSVLISETDFEGSYHLKQLKETPEYGGGAIYSFYENDEFVMEVWLCKVTAWVFDKLPKDIFVAPVRF